VIVVESGENGSVVVVIDESGKSPQFSIDWVAILLCRSVSPILSGNSLKSLSQKEKT
jgi:hypothetical protein